MPELPEVQTIVNDLNKKVVGEKIVDFWSDWKKSVRPNFTKFKKEILKNQKDLPLEIPPESEIVNVRRIGKHIIIDLNNKNSIVIHLKMSGHLLFKPNKRTSKVHVNEYFNDRVNQYVHHIFTFKNKATLEFSDLRKFGWLIAVKTEEVKNIKEIQKLGIDALSSTFTLKIFKEILNKKQKSIIGVVLLDQHLIAGIGNIYRSEILFGAGVNPKRKVVTLKEKEIEKIFKGIKSILKKAIKMGGTSDLDYRDTDGKEGRFQKLLKVYRREKQKCFG